MGKKKSILEQHIAVFGESGSGKTVLVSSFYGAAQEAIFRKNSLFHIVARDLGQGSSLNRNYLGMRDENVTPHTTQFAATSYDFSITLRKASGAKTSPFDAARLVWHDYPGDWFEKSVTGEEAMRRVSTFRQLLESDIAILLVDGQRLLDNKGQEDRYLKSLFSNFANGLVSLREDVLVDGNKLVQFPRIWVLALSKADLHPELDTYMFRDLLDLHAADDIDELRKVIESFVESPKAMSVGDDFLLLSSAKFETGRIEVKERVGVDLVLPLATILPLERHAAWAKIKGIPADLAAQLLDPAAQLLAAAIAGKKLVKLPGPLALVAGFIGNAGIDVAVEMAGEKLQAVKAQALSDENFITAVLTQFKEDLELAEKNDVFMRSLL